MQQANKYEHRTEKEIVFWIHDGKSVVKIFNGKEHGTITSQEKKEHINRSWQYEELLVPYDGKEADIEANYHAYIQSIDNIKGITNNLINMYRTGSIFNTAKALFVKLTTIPESRFDKVEAYEFDYLNSCGGGVRIAEEYEGKAFKYDVNSFYPYLLNTNMLRIPQKKGTLTDIDQQEFDEQEFVTIGIYHASITGDINPKLFTVLKSNKYTHYEINRAKKLKYSIKILGQALMWTPDQVVGAKKVFGEFVEYLFPLKKKDPVLKQILNSLWGGLVSSRSTYTRVDTVENLDIPQGATILKAEQLTQDIYKFTIHDKDCNTFKTNYGRLKPFLLGLGRCIVHKTIEEAGHEYIVYSHTDSLISRKFLNLTKNLNDRGLEMGQWKYEGRDNECEVFNMSRYKFEKSSTKKT